MVAAAAMPLGSQPATASPPPRRRGSGRPGSGPPGRPTRPPRSPRRRPSSRPGDDRRAVVPSAQQVRRHVEVASGKNRTSGRASAPTIVRSPRSPSEPALSRPSPRRPRGGRATPGGAPRSRGQGQVEAFAQAGGERREPGARGPLRDSGPRAAPRRLRRLRRRVACVAHGADGTAARAVPDPTRVPWRPGRPHSPPMDLTKRPEIPQSRSELSAIGPHRAVPSLEPHVPDPTPSPPMAPRAQRWSRRAWSPSRAWWPRPAGRRRLDRRGGRRDHLDGTTPTGPSRRNRRRATAGGLAQPGAFPERHPRPGPGRRRARASSRTRSATASTSRPPPSTPAPRRSRRCSPRPSTPRYIGPNPAINGFAQSDGEAVRIISGTHLRRRLPRRAADEIDVAEQLDGTTLATPVAGQHPGRRPAGLAGGAGLRDRRRTAAAT